MVKESEDRKDEGGHKNKEVNEKTKIKIEK
jgi:hypothetical protein